MNCASFCFFTAATGSGRDEWDEPLLFLDSWGEDDNDDDEDEEL